jgi:hemolysin III
VILQGRRNRRGANWEVSLRRLMFRLAPPLCPLVTPRPPRGSRFSGRRLVRQAWAARLRARRAVARRQERASSATHALGLLLALCAVPALMILAYLHGSPLHLAGFGVYGGALVLAYAASTLYHGARKPRLRRRFRVLDHAAIYVLIAGTYTPIVLFFVEGFWRGVVLGAVWALAVLGVVFKLWYTGRYPRVSLAFYLAMGWGVVLAPRQILDAVPFPVLLWLLAGGLFYTVGAVFYRWERVPYNHVVWHLFVLGGSVCHFVAVAAYAW